MKSKLLIIGLIIAVSFFNNICYSQKSNNIVLKSNKKSIIFYSKERDYSWGISPELNPDCLKIFCLNNEKNIIKFKSDIDSLQFEIKNKDTFRFTVILRDTIKAFTEVVGVQDIPNSISVKDKLFYLSQFWSEAKYNFVNMDSTKFSWDSLYYCYINRIIETKNDYDYYQELKRFAASLQDGHTEISEGLQFFVFKDYINVSIKDFDKKIYIVNALKKTGLDSTFIGAQLIEFKGMPINKYLNDSIFPYISSSTEQSLWMQGVSALQSGFKNSRFQGKVIKTNGEIAIINLPYNGETTRNDNDLHWGLSSSRSNNYVSLKWLQDTIAYISISSFYPEEEVIKEFENYIDSIKKSKALIIDIRENGGGSTDVAWHIQSHLTKGDYFLNFAYQTRINNGVRKANGNWIDEYKDFYLNKALENNKPDTIYVSDTIYKIKVPVVILIGRYTFSAAEDLLVNLYEAPARPLFIGEPTGGSTGSPLVVPDFPNGGAARICTRRVCFPYSGKPFINQGIIPDILISKSINNYLKGIDETLDSAVKILTKRIQKNYLSLSNEKLMQLGVEVIDEGIFYKNINPQINKINGFYCIKNNYSTIVRLSENEKQSKVGNKYFNQKASTNFDFYPIIITNNSEDATYVQGYKGKLLPIIVNMANCKNSKRTDNIVIWFKVTESLLKSLSEIYKIDDYIQFRVN